MIRTSGCDCCLALPGFMWIQWKAIVRANFSTSVPSVSYRKEGTLTLEVICIIELLTMKGLWMCLEVLR